MKTALVGLVAVFAVLQYQLWFDDAGLLASFGLDRQLTQKMSRNDQVRQQNLRLAHEVSDLKTGVDALEERARYDLRLIKPRETFYQYVRS